MSDAPRPAQAPGDTTRRPARASLAWPRVAALGLAAVWLVVGLVLAAALSRDGTPEISGDLQGLIVAEHRAPTGEPLLLLRVQDEQLDAEQSGEEALLNAAQRIAERLASERVPLSPPAAELTAWLDAHALYMLPLSSHAALSEALSDAAMQDAVDGLKARLSSPMFGVSDEQPRRDPLSLSRLTDKAAGQLGRLSDPGATGARPTAIGDLVALDGRSVLIQLQTERALPAVERDVADALADLPVTARLLGTAAAQARAVQRVHDHLGRLFLVTLAGITIVLAVALRSVRTVLLVVGCIATAVAGFVVFGPPLDVLSVPLCVLLVGFGCEGALALQRISERGWPAAGVLGTALLPLLLSPYPEWAAWSWYWLAGVVLVTTTLRIVLPPVTGLVGGAPAWQRRGFLLRPTRALAVVLSVGTMAAGGWSVSRLTHHGLDQPLLADTDPATQIVREHFFDPRRVVQAQTIGRDAVDAVTLAAGDARALAELVPEHAVRIDSPGGFVLPTPELERRRAALAALDLDGRMDVLFEQLSNRGFRPDAFGEFLRSASDLANMPTPQAALDGPLGPWIARYLHEGPDAVVLRNLVHLRAGTGPPPTVTRADGTPLPLRGPAIASRNDRVIFSDWLGIYIALQLWIGALVVWLGTRSMAIAIGATVAALTAQTAVLAAMVPLSLPLGAELVPAFVLVGAAGIVAGGRACRAVALQRPFFATGLLVTGLCQTVAGLALVATAEPLWTRMGLVIAIGTLAASGAGLFIAPGIAKLLRPEFGDDAPPETQA